MYKLSEIKKCVEIYLHSPVHLNVVILIQVVGELYI
jgi:hypothetical protein